MPTELIAAAVLTVVVGIALICAFGAWITRGFDDIEDDIMRRDEQ